IAFEYQFGVGERVGVDCTTLHHANGAALHRAGDAYFVAAHWQDGIVEAGACEQRTSRRYPKAHRNRNRLIVSVILVRHLPHVRAGRNLERTDIAPTEIHAVVTEIGAAIELVETDAANPGTDGELGLVSRMADRHHVLVNVIWSEDDMLLHRRLLLLLRNNHRLERLAEGLGNFARALYIVLPAEHLVDDVHVAEQVGDDPVIRLAL